MNCQQNILRLYNFKNPSVVDNDYNLFIINNKLQGYYRISTLYTNIMYHIIYIYFFFMRIINLEIFVPMPFGFFKAANLYDLLYLLNLKCS